MLCTLRGSLKAGPDPHTPPVKALGRTQAQSGLLDPDIPPGKAWGGCARRVGALTLTHLQGRPGEDASVEWAPRPSHTSREGPGEDTSTEWAP